MNTSSLAPRRSRSALISERWVMRAAHSGVTKSTSSSAPPIRRTGRGHGVFASTPWSRSHSTTSIRPASVALWSNRAANGARSTRSGTSTTSVANSSTLPRWARSTACFTVRAPTPQEATGCERCLDAPRRPSSRLVLGVDKCKGHCSGSFEDAGSVAFSGHRVAQGAAEMVEPPLGDRPGDGQVLVVLIQRAPSRFAVAGRSPEPFGEESLLPVAAVREVPAEERSDHGVGLEAVVEGVHEPVDGGLSTNAVEQGAVLERPKAGREVQQATVAYVRVDARAPPRHAPTLSRVVASVPAISLRLSSEAAADRSIGGSDQPYPRGVKPSRSTAGVGGQSRRRRRTCRREDSTSRPRAARVSW